MFLVFLSMVEMD